MCQSDESDAACCIGIAGDFLPAGDLQAAAPHVWQEKSSEIAPHFHDLAVSFVNLESPIDVEDLEPDPKMALGQNFSAPERALGYLAAIHASVVGLANNHILDFGSMGVRRTEEALRRRAMVPLGVGRSLSDAPQVFVWEGPDQVRVGFWAAASKTRGSATQRRPGVEVASIDRGRRAFEEMKSKGARCFIALLHAGTEHTNRPDPDDLKLLDGLAGQGFDIVAACHSHRISGYKTIRRANGRPAYCFYGLGSIASGCLYSRLEREGILLVAGLNSQGSLVRIEARPVYLSGQGWGTLSGHGESEAILERFKSVSAEIADGTYQRLYYEDVGKRLFELQLRDARVAYQQGGYRGLMRKLLRLRMRHLRQLIQKVVG